jgi:hypothetical protein
MLLLQTLLIVALSGTPDDGLKSASGVVVSADVASNRAIVRTPAGPVTFLTDGAKGLENLAPGAAIEVKYVLHDGARVTEVTPAQPVVSTAAPEPLPMTPENLKSTAGTIATLDSTGTKLLVLSPAGLVTFTTTPALTQGLLVGQEIRVWYFVANGALVNKIDVLAPAAKSKAVSQRP